MHTRRSPESLYLRVASTSERKQNIEKTYCLTILVRLNASSIVLPVVGNTYLGNPPMRVDVLGIPLIGLGVC